ncbi:hypothetical protein [Deinococcus multiflagellatus]|uniref:Uncharacterized protein n=1 Tax=Deinococcus multiflagellatus TaxID=1656887 RepID=A0ABW1ZJR7_9DEIO|nr:hypothetical protein [Deinococcus multiflagellatus]MBZ9714609.1 hypothetical protein [Deinococcus multiflagellatus]
MPRVLPALVALLLVCAGAVWWASGARWRGALYCFEQPGQVWGVAPMPAGATPTCPESRSVRAEVRAGQTRLEQYLFSDWQPEAVLKRLEDAGFARLTTRPDDGVQLEVVLTRGQERVLYIAEHRGAGTLVHVGSTPVR